VVGRAQAASRHRRAGPRARRRAAHVGLRAPLEPAPATAAVVAGLRASVTGPGPDRHLAPEIDAAHTFVTTGAALAAAETVTGTLR
jgi:histidine ammonia-lyase